MSSAQRHHSVRYVLLGILLVGSAVGLGAGTGLALGPSVAAAPHGSLLALAHPAPASSHLRPFVIAHGDLVVGPSNSPYVLSPQTTGATTYYQEGNVTVLPGGRLYVENLTLSMLQFIGNTGSVGARASHLYNFTVEGLAEFVGAALTTNVSVLNAFVKLTVNVTGGGTLVANDSTFAFPGTIFVNGTGSHFFANGSSLVPNPGVAHLSENLTLAEDTDFSPGLVVTDHARVSLGASDWLSYYHDNLTTWGIPGPNLTEGSYDSVDPNGNMTWSSLAPRTPVAETLALSLGYRAYTGGAIVLTYTSNVTAHSLGSHLTFLDTNYSVGTIDFPKTATNVTAQVVVPLPAGLLTAVDQRGVMELLQATGAFGTPSQFSFTLGKSNTTNFHASAASVLFAPTPQWDMAMSGGSNFTAADSTLALTWNALPGTPVGSGAERPTPWASNKITLQNGSHAYLANVSVPTPFDTVFDNQSIVLPLDNSSAAYTYRWGTIQAISGAFGPIPGVRVAVYSAFGANQTDNATATALNNLSAADPDLSGYLVHWIDDHHAVYGTTNDTGDASLLLASSVITAASLPTGVFVGSYHFATRLAGGGPNSSDWIFGGVTPYPLDMSPAGSDVLPQAQYPNYHAELAIGTVAVLGDGGKILNSTIVIGQNVTFSVPVTNVGTAALVNFTTGFGFVLPAPFLPLTLSPTREFQQLDPGQTQTVNFTWKVNESVVGLGGVKHVSFLFNASWNGGKPPVGDIIQTLLPMTVEPAYISLSFSPPANPLAVGQSYQGVGTLTFAGSGLASVNVTLTDGPQVFLVGQGGYPAGRFVQPIALAPGITPGGIYTLHVQASYNGRTVWDNFTNGVRIAGTAPPAPSFWSESILGPITGLLLVIILAVAAGAAVAFLMVTGRFSRGKLAECGECGSLIPESAAACPKCGAEFESDLVRCSRCSSTIPASSEVCPECAAQLLGPPTPESKDPERQGFADFVERYRGEAKKELAENYGEGAFWDWWKRQPSYVSFEQWKAQQSASSRPGMTAPLVTGPAPPAAPPDAAAAAPPPAPTARGASPRGASPPAPAARPAGSGPVPASARSVQASAASAAPPAGTFAGSAAAGGEGDVVPEPAPGLRPCANCSKEIPTDFLVCPFCGAVTR